MAEIIIIIGIIGALVTIYEHVHRIYKERE